MILQGIISKPVSTHENSYKLAAQQFHSNMMCMYKTRQALWEESKQHRFRDSDRCSKIHVYTGYDNMKFSSQPWQLWFKNGEQRGSTINIKHVHKRVHPEAEDMDRIVRLHSSKQAGKATHAADLIASVNYLMLLGLSCQKPIDYYRNGRFHALGDSCKPVPFLRSPNMLTMCKTRPQLCGSCVALPFSLCPP